jgi:hypothetical protein
VCRRSVQSEDFSVGRALSNLGMHSASVPTSWSRCGPAIATVP